MGDVSAWGDKVGGNCWRTTGDINDSWSSMAGIGFAQSDHAKYAKPGCWNDPDMLVVGHVGWGPSLHPSRLTPNEQYTHISLWCLLSSPLLIGCDLTKLDDFTLGLLTNDEVLEVNQDPLGKQATRVVQEGTTEVWGKQLADGSWAVGLFNRGILPADVSFDLAKLGLGNKVTVRDLWRQQDTPGQSGGLKARLPRHGCALFKVSRK
jgi:alpha-galactosidase